MDPGHEQAHPSERTAKLAALLDRMAAEARAVIQSARVQTKAPGLERVAELLGQAQRRPRWRVWTWQWSLLAAGLLCVMGIAWWQTREGPGEREHGVPLGGHQLVVKAELDGAGIIRSLS